MLAVLGTPSLPIPFRTDDEEGCPRYAFRPTAGHDGRGAEGANQPFSISATASRSLTSSSVVFWMAAFEKSFSSCPCTIS